MSGGFGTTLLCQKRDVLLDPDIIPICGLNNEDLNKLFYIWWRYHLNDMKAGTPKQTEALWNWKRFEYATKHPTYEETCKYLDNIKLLYDQGFRYGTRWFKHVVPEDILEWLFSLPGNGDTYTPFVEISDNELISILKGD